LLSQVNGAKFTDAEIAALTHRIQFGGDEVVKAKDGAGSATLSMAHAGHVFTSRVLDALSGQKNVIENAFVENKLTPAPYFSTPVTPSPPPSPRLSADSLRF
jgi:malate dehydrogenase